jgi:hypothetical protein
MGSRKWVFFLLNDESQPQFNNWTALQYWYIANPNSEYSATSVDIVNMPILNWDTDAVDKINRNLIDIDVTEMPLIMKVLQRIHRAQL